MRTINGGSPRLVYAHSSNVDEEDLLGKMSYPYNSNDFLKSFLINEGASENVVSYYERVHDSDLLSWGNLLRFKKKLFGDKARGRPDQSSLGNIFTTGLPQEDAGRYYSS